jgi:hypothetical protein
VKIKNLVIAKSKASLVSRIVKSLQRTQVDLFNNAQSCYGKHSRKRFSWIVTDRSLHSETTAPSLARKHEMRLLLSVKAFLIAYLSGVETISSFSLNQIIAFSLFNSSMG